MRLITLKRAFIGLMVFGALFPFWVSAEETLPAPQIKYVVIDLNQVLGASKIGQEILARENADLDDLKAWDAKITKELELEEADIAGKRDSLSAKEFSMLALEFERKSETFRMEITQKDAARLNRERVWETRFIEIVREVSANWAKSAGVDIIFLRESVFWFDSSIDLSEAVANNLDERYEITGDAFSKLIFAPVDEPLEALSGAVNEKPLSDTTLEPKGN